MTSRTRFTRATMAGSVSTTGSAPIRSDPIMTRAQEHLLDNEFTVEIDTRPFDTTPLDTTPPGNIRSERESVVRGGIWSAASQLVPALGTAVLSVAAGRLLGSGPLGQQSLIAYVNSAVTSVLVISLNTALLQVGGSLRGAGATARLRRLTRWSIGAHAGTGIVVALLMLSSGEVVGHSRSAWLVIGGVSILDALADGLAVRLILSEGWAPIGRLRLVFQMFGPLLGIAFLFAGWGITGIFVGDGVAALGLLVAVARRFSRSPPELLDRARPDAAKAAGAAPRSEQERPHPGPGLRRRRQPTDRHPYRPLPGTRRSTRLAAPSPVLGVFLLFALSAVITQVVSKRVEFVVLSAFSGDRAVGQYSVAFMAVSLVSMVPLGVATAAMPVIAAAMGRGAITDTYRHLRYALRVGTAVTIPLTGLLAALGPSAVEFVYGDRYRTAAHLVSFASATLLVAVISGLCEQFWAAQARLGIVLGTGALAGVIDIGLALALVPRFGSAGAVAANVSGQAALAIGLLAVTVRNTGAIGWRLRGLSGCVLSGIAGAGTVALVRLAVDRFAPFELEARSAISLVVGTIFGLAVAVTVAVAVRPLNPGEAGWLGALLPKRLIGPIARVTRPDPAEPRHD